MAILTQDLLKSLLHYDPETGVFTWLINRPNGVKVGHKSGNRTVKGYLHISIYGRQYKAHRLAWLYIHGVWPETALDHINRDGCDNRLCNLRLATHSQNMQNRRSKYGGVTFRHGYWRARISIDNRQIFLGQFKDKADAIAARKAAELKYHTHRPIHADSHILSGRRTEADGDLVVGASEERSRRVREAGVPVGEAGDAA